MDRAERLCEKLDEKRQELILKWRVEQRRILTAQIEQTSAEVEVLKGFEDELEKQAEEFSDMATQFAEKSVEVEVTRKQIERIDATVDALAPQLDRLPEGRLARGYSKPWHVARPPG